MPAAIDPNLTGLQPAAVWQHFATLCRTPRHSKGEGPLRENLRQWASSRGLTTIVDAAGNLLVRKAASRGAERAPGVILQAHLDMVCQKTPPSQHDFSRDPIRPRCRDGWLVADETTLGADNGIGVALILAALADGSVHHGPIEALLTVDEEDGMGGAHGLAPSLLRGHLLLNLDTEEWGEFFVGCAGGLDVNVHRPAKAEGLPAACEVWRIELQGLRGGHSGIDIHAQRGNAIKLLVRVLRDIEERWPLRLVDFVGGSARNALPHEATATVALPAGLGTALATCLSHWQARLRQELSGIDDRLRIDCKAATADRVLAAAEQAIWLRSLHAAPHGVRRYSLQLPGVVETSNNLGMVRITADEGSCNFMVRSLLDSGSAALAEEIVSLFALSGTIAEQAGHYPGWAPNRESPLLALCRAVFAREFGHEAKVQVIHAGLECGLIAARYPDLDMISFGPTIRGAHAPGECVDIASVGNAWRLLTAILAATAALPQQ
ncbi:MAG: aminoacyl-histidine dipeptidase [Accumulibacter sp.]|jgi:dipeptidase D|uniref:aminoacyl-histidine dipeptidase n=1 Tax=Accumulibacter sp. TaxID=2053492 RepID=UPI002FC2FD60